MPTYKILSLTPMGTKTGMTVTFIDDVNGKPPVTSYHEVESIDSAVIAEQLAITAREYEARIPEAVTQATPVTGVAVVVPTET